MSPVLSAIESVHPFTLNPPTRRTPQHPTTLVRFVLTLLLSLLLLLRSYLRQVVVKTRPVVLHLQDLLSLFKRHGDKKWFGYSKSVGR